MFSRKRYQEALRACKDIAKDRSKPFLHRLRAAELVCLIYGLELPVTSTKRDRRAVSDLVESRGLERYVREQVDARVRDQTQGDGEGADLSAQDGIAEAWNAALRE